MYLSTVALCTWHCDKLVLRTCTFPTYSKFLVSLHCLTAAHLCVKVDVCPKAAVHITTHQHCTEALLQLFFRWHGKFQSGGLFLRACGSWRGRRRLALLPLRYLYAPCCVSHDCISDLIQKTHKNPALQNLLQQKTVLRGLTIIIK